MTSNPSKFISHLLPLITCVLVAIVGISCTSEEEETKVIIAKAEQGDAEAQSLLGYMYINGEGVLKDYKEAVKWIRKAAEQGYAEAQYNLGLRYVNGEGVPQDYVRAYAWGNVGSANGSDNGSELRDLMAKALTPRQISEAQKLSKVWFEKYQPKE